MGHKYKYATPKQTNPRFPKKHLSVTQLATSSPADRGLVRGDEGISQVAGPVVAPGAGNDLCVTFKARSPTQDRDLIADAARPSKMAATVKPWAAIRVRIMS